MDKNEETIVVGMQFDFTATKTLEKPLHPDENPVECSALPNLWVLNREGQLAGWTIIYVPGIVAGERALEMRAAEKQDAYWQRERETVRKAAEQVDEREQRDREVWEKARRESKGTAAVQTTRKKSEPTVSSTQSPAQVPSQPSPERESQKTTFGQPTRPGAATFGQPSQLGGTLPGQSHVFGQSTGLSSINPPQPGNLSAVGFAKYSSIPPSQTPGSLSGSQSSQSGFLSGAGSSGSFLSGAKGGSFLQSGQSSSFLSGGQGNTFVKSGQDQGFTKFATSTPAGQDHGFAKYVTNTPRGFGTPQSMTTPSWFAEGGFLGTRPAASSASTLNVSPKGSLSERTQSLTSPSIRNQSFDISEDSSQEDIDSDRSDLEESAESEGDNSVRADVLDFGDALNLDGRKSTETRPEPATPIKKDVSISVEQSPSLVADGEFVKVEIPVTPSPEKGKPGSEESKDITPSARDKSRPAEDSPPAFTPLQKETTPQIDTKATPIPALAEKPIPIVVEKADPFSTPSRPSKPTTSLAVPPLTNSQFSSKETMSQTASPVRGKGELRQFGLVSGSAPTWSRLPESADLSNAFRLVVEQVSKELVQV